MSDNLKTRASARLRLFTAMITIATMLPQGRSFRANRMGALRLEHVGYGLAVAGAVLALVAFLGAVFIPVATVALIYWEVLALLGAILLVIGLVVHAAE